MADHPIALGQNLDGGTIIAWGYYAEDEPSGDILSVMTLLDEENRTPNETNYAVFHYRPATDTVFYKQTFPNIVPTVQTWESDYGMDF